MKKLDLGLYECKVCDEKVETGPHHDPPLSILVSCHGQPDQRMVMINGYEIHRCPFPVPAADAAFTPGTHTAALLLDKGMSFDAVVRGLVVSVGISADQATHAVTAATDDRNRTGRVRDF
jgi:hypothetical protein